MPSKKSFSSSNNRIAEVLQPFVDSCTLAGAVALVASKEGVLALETVGYADIAAKKPMQPDSFFWIASISKPITATALMMLVDEGKVSIEDPVETYVPEFKEVMVGIKQENDQILLKKPDRCITIKHLLSQTSGLPFMTPLEQPVMDKLPLADLVKLYALLPLLSEPGTQFQYSNENFSAAGRIIEIVSGMPYEDFLATRLFEPLGMKDTTFWPNDEQIGRQAKVYKPNEAKTALEESPIIYLNYPLSDRIRRHPTPGGGLFSTANDLSIFGRMILAGGVLDGKSYVSEASIREMSRRQTPGELAESYGLGWWTPDQTFDHGGAYATHLWLDPRKQLVTVLLMQHAGFPNPEDGQKIEGAFKEAAERMA